MFNFSRIDKWVLQMVYSKVWLVALIVAFALLFTFFAAIFLIVQCQLSILVTAGICLAPWVLAIVAALWSLCFARRQYQQQKSELLALGRHALLGRLVLLAANYFLKKTQDK